MRRIIQLIVVLATACAAFGEQPDPLEYLRNQLQDKDQANNVLAALRSTGDKDLTVVFEAVSRSGDKDWRLFGTAALRDVAGDGAKVVLAERLKEDPAMIVRSEALVQLLGMKALGNEQLIEALKMPDEHVQCIAARALAAAGKGDAATDTLKKLSLSRDLMTSTMARMCLLGLGDKEQLAILDKTVKDEKTEPEILSLLLDQATEEKIAAAAPLLEILMKPQQPWPLRVQACRTMAALSPNGSAVIRAMLDQTTQTVPRVYLLAALADRPDAAKELKAYTEGGADDAVAVLARFELARTAADKTTTDTVAAAMKLGHPVVLDQVVRRAAADIADKSAASEFYVPALLDMVRAANGDLARPTAEHYRGARAATLLADSGSKAAAEGLAAIMADKYGPVIRTAATGLLRTKNKAACDLVRPLLKSPHEELVTDAALILGKFADGDAKAPLADILAHKDKHPTVLVALASWYLIKIDGKTAAAGQSLAKEVK